MNLKHSDRHSPSHHKHPFAAAAATRNAVSRRRSSRMMLHAAVGISGEDRSNIAFTTNAKATSLNRHGAAVHLSCELQVGSVVRVKNQRGEQVSARVVAQLRAVQGISTYAIEFMDQEEKATNFWGIFFPPNATDKSKA